ncbi:MAG TPA: hypothetical protein VF182_00415 [Candidatus Binatia bacterium]
MVETVLTGTARAPLQPAKLFNQLTMVQQFDLFAVNRENAEIEPSKLL